MSSPAPVLRLMSRSEQLRQRIDQTQVDVNLALKDSKQEADAAADRAQSKWACMRAYA
jgi:hypothetical protein